jgi:molybdenum-dependent DNA-binding transcriptional regulator ModE
MERSIKDPLQKIQSSIMMKYMSKFDYSDLDGRLLRLLVAVVEEGSVTGAANRLGVTQSAVSHMLDKLRAITADPLFVKCGRGIVATARAELLA